LLAQVPEQWQSRWGDVADVSRLAFVRTLSPSAAVRPPKGDDWLHEPKWDGFRFQVIKDGSRVRFYSRHGAEYTDRLPAMVEAFGKLPTQSAILDGELVLIDRRGSAHFYRLMAQMRTSHPDESQLMFMAFDLLHQDGVDLRALPLSERKRDLRRLCRKSRVPFMREVQTFPNGTLLFDHCRKFGFEGVVSKRLASRYAGGPNRNWVKTKCPGWKRINSERYRLFEGPRKPELSEAQKTLTKKRQELARVLEWLESPGLIPGIARELRKHVAILEQEIAELEQA
jgi:bifunctional non-homologous end joining protein LigD